MTKPMRIFLAIDLNDEIKSQIKSIQYKLQPFFDENEIDVNWIKPELAHITIKFFGYIRPNQVARITKTLNKKLTASPFKIKLSKIDAFPDFSKPKVIWVGMDEGLDALKNLVSDVEFDLYGEGFSRESRPFKGHITIARLKEKVPADFTFALNEVDIPKDLTQFVETLTLVESTLSAEGPAYEVLEEFKLKTSRK